MTLHHWAIIKDNQIIDEHWGEEGTPPLTTFLGGDSAMDYDEAVALGIPNAIPPAYVALRAAAYPSIGDQLDAVLKQLNAMQMNGETNLIAPLDEVIQQWLKVKRDFPKE